MVPDYQTDLATLTALYRHGRSRDHRAAGAAGAGGRPRKKAAAQPGRRNGRQ
jgi:hypothetical protein